MVEGTTWHHIRQYFSEPGITPEPTMPYTPLQSDKVERLNRTLMDIECDACCSSLVYLQSCGAGQCNVQPTSGTGRRILTSQSLALSSSLARFRTVSHIRAFGARAYVHVPPKERNKLDSRTVVGNHDWV